MRAAIKFCGLTRAEDAAEAGRLGAAYCGVIFAGGPRAIQPARAAEVLDGAGSGVRRVGVFGDQPDDTIAASADAARLDVIQLHGGLDPARAVAMRARLGRELWAVVRVESCELPPELPALFEAADAVLIDARVPGLLGGSGASFDWAGTASAIDRARGAGRFVLAGGLTPENVARAVTLLRPDVVDVSSGVELAPGVKDPERMRAFARAVGSSDE